MQKSVIALSLRLFELKHEDDVYNLIKMTNKGLIYKHFFEYLNSKIAEKELKMSDVIRDSGVNSNYVYSIVNGRRLNPGRDKVIALCIGAHFDLGEVMSALDISGKKLISPTNERDAWIALTINQKEYNVLKLNLRLEEKGLEPLDL